MDTVCVFGEGRRRVRRFLQSHQGPLTRNTASGGCRQPICREQLYGICRRAPLTGACGPIVGRHDMGFASCSPSTRFSNNMGMLALHRGGNYTITVVRGPRAWWAPRIRGAG